ncbi:hypothetical protein HGB07_02585 [Candidatus Roizmanbacteria bacterium]|nr:hypothetical protein [Candidatus Roizmanbacteria bacterium]
MLPDSEPPFIADRHLEGILKYEIAPKADDFIYYYSAKPHANSEQMYVEVIQPAISTSEARWKMDFNRLPWNTLPARSQRIPYFAIDVGNPLDLSTSEKNYLKRLASLPFSRVNLISVFNDKEVFHSEIPALDRILGVNTIYPDTELQGLRTISSDDLKDNIICETLRLKYNPRQHTEINDIINLFRQQQNASKEIERFSHIFDAYHLFHRAPTDGALVLDSLISSTKTFKNTMNVDDFTLLLLANPNQNSIDYAGKKLPSSDAPELLTLRKTFPQWRYVIHFHHNSITRGGQFPDHVTSTEMEYGTFETGNKLIAEFKRIQDNWLIIKNHGVIYLGNTIDDFESFLINTLHL